MAIKKLPGGVEDLTLGMGTENQERNGNVVLITQLNGSNIPYSDTQSINQKVDQVQNTVDPIRADIDAHKARTDNPHSTTPENIGASPENHTHQIDEIGGVDPLLEAKVNKTGDTMTGSLDVPGVKVTLVGGDSLIDFGNTAHIKFNTSDRDFSVMVPDGANVGPHAAGNKLWHAGNFDAPGHTHSENFSKAEHVEFSDGVADAGKPVILDAGGHLDVSFLETGAFYYVTGYTPVAGTEYPDTTGEDVGAMWSIEGVDDIDGYTFVGGDLIGKTVKLGNLMLWATDGWVATSGLLVPSDYYKLDGSQSLTAAFQAGGQPLANVGDGVLDDDGVNKLQMDTADTAIVATTMGHSNEFFPTTSLDDYLEPGVYSLVYEYSQSVPATASKAGQLTVTIINDDVGDLLYVLQSWSTRDNIYNRRYDANNDIWWDWTTINPLPEVESGGDDVTGYWVKSQDGTLTMHGRKTVSVLLGATSATVSVVLPVQSAILGVFTPIQETTAGDMRPYLSDVGPSSVSPSALYTFTATIVDGTFTIGWTYIGRWK
jgi:hypothetical protein